MSDEQLERELKALAKEVRLSNKVREGVERKARQMDDDAIVRTGTGRSVTRRNLLWGGAVSASVAASLLGLAILGRNQQNDQDSLLQRVRVILLCCVHTPRACPRRTEACLPRDSLAPLAPRAPQIPERGMPREISTLPAWGMGSSQLNIHSLGQMQVVWEVKMRQGKLS